MSKLLRNRFFYAAVLLIYGALIALFVLEPVFGKGLLKGKSLKLAVVLSLFSLIMSLVIVLLERGKVQRRIDEMLAYLQHRFIHRLLFGSIAASFLVCPVIMFTTEIHDIHICDSLWLPAWIVSLAAAVAVGAFCIRPVRREEFYGRVTTVFVCLVPAGITYGFLIQLFKLIAFWFNCTDPH